MKRGDRVGYADVNLHDYIGIIEEIKDVCDYSILECMQCTGGNCIVRWNYQCEQGSRECSYFLELKRV